MRKRRILIGLSLLKPVSTIGDKNNLSRGGRGETRTGTFFTGGYGWHGSEGVLKNMVAMETSNSRKCHIKYILGKVTKFSGFLLGSHP